MIVKLCSSLNPSVCIFHIPKVIEVKVLFNLNVYIRKIWRIQLDCGGLLAIDLCFCPADMYIGRVTKKQNKWYSV